MLYLNSTSLGCEMFKFQLQKLSKGNKATNGVLIPRHVRSMTGLSSSRSFIPSLDINGDWWRILPITTAASRHPLAEALLRKLFWKSLYCLGSKLDKIHYLCCSPSLWVVNQTVKMFLEVLNCPILEFLWVIKLRYVCLTQNKASR